jgi:hypothetical protein
VTGSDSPAVRAVPALRSEVVLDRNLPLGEISGVVELLDTFGAVGIDHVKLITALRAASRLTAQILTGSLKPPEHTSSGKQRIINCFGAKRENV